MFGRIVCPRAYNYTVLPRQNRRLFYGPVLLRGFLHLWLLASWMNDVSSPSLQESAKSTALAGSSDALGLARLAQAARPLVVFCAQASEAHRLREEIAWFSPAL